MVSLVFLGLAIVCALISRILLLIAAIDISAWLGLRSISPRSVPYSFGSIIPRQRVIRFFFEWQPSCAFLAFVVSQPRMTFTCPKISSDGGIAAAIKANQSDCAMEKAGHSKK